MDSARFIDTVVEWLFVRGFNCRNIPMLAAHIRSNWERLESTEPASVAVSCLGWPGLVYKPTSSMGEGPSDTAGAGDRWLAVHEAGHAIVGIRANLKLWGIRFYGATGITGETGFEEFDWTSSNDESLLRQHIRIDVAANLAEMILAVRVPDGGYPSRFFDSQRPTREMHIPSDIIGAWKKAHRVVTVRNEEFEVLPEEETLWTEGRTIVAEAEVEAEQVLKSHLEGLERLADQLQRGPMSGAAVRLLLDGAAN